MRSIAVAVLVGGCNQVLGLAATIPVDASVIPDAPDRDSDGVPDLIDNCPDAANAGQHDVDADGIGDACDNCPIVANSKQEHVGDLDDVGDACDPNATLAGDCLLLFDAFDDPSLFAQRWQVEPASLAGSVMASSGELRIAATATRVAVFSRDVGAQVTGAQMAATKLDPTAGEAGVVTATTTDLKAGFLCWVAPDSATSLLSLHAEIANLGDNPEPMSSDPVDRGLVVRLAVPVLPISQTILQCRADYGIATATKRIGTVTVTTSMYAGMFASVQPVIVHAIAMYGRMDPCPAPIIH